MNVGRSCRGGLAAASCAACIACTRFAALVALRIKVISQRWMIESVRRKARDVIRVCLRLCGRESIGGRGTERRRAHLIVDIVTIVDTIGRRW